MSVCVCLNVCVWVYTGVAPWLIHMFIMTHSYLCHDSFICVPWLFHVCHDSFICVRWLFCVCHDSFIRVPWLFHVCHDSFVMSWLIHARHDSSICVMTHPYMPWLIFVCAMTHQYMPWLIYICHDSSIYALTHLSVSHIDPSMRLMWLIHMCHNSFIKGCCRPISSQLQFTWLYTYSYVLWLIHMCRDSFTCAVTHS